MPWDLVEIVSGLLIAFAALYAVLNALHGRWLEYRASHPDYQDQRETLIAKARTKYLQVSLSHPLVLVALTVGVVLQILVGLRKLICEFT